MTMILMSRGSVFLGLLLLLGCSQGLFRGHEKQIERCFVSDEMFRENLKSGISERLESSPGGTAVETGRKIYLSLDASLQKKLDVASSQENDARDFYDRTEKNLSELNFPEYFDGCKEEAGDYEKFLMIDWMLSIAGEKWATYQPNSDCTGYCAEIAKYGQFNATEKLKIALYSFLFQRKNPDASADEIEAALSLKERGKRP
jgi:hypothetical protein